MIIMNSNRKKLNNDLYLFCKCSSFAKLRVSDMYIKSKIFDLVISNDTVVHMNLNHNKNGTIIGKEVLHFVLRDPAVQSGLAAVYSFTLVS